MEFIYPPLHDLYLLLRKLIQLVHQTIYLLIGCVDLTLERFFLVRGFDGPELFVEVEHAVDNAIRVGSCNSLLAALLSFYPGTLGGKTSTQHPLYLFAKSPSPVGRPVSEIYYTMFELIGKKPCASRACHLAAHATSRTESPCDTCTA